MRLERYIARRYLFAPKSHNVINIISAISATGMAIGTAALIIILSVYNGFDGIIRDNLSDIDPDLLVVPAQGKSFVPDAAFVGWLEDGGADVCEVVQENIFFRYASEQGVAKARGVQQRYLASSRLADHVIEGEAGLNLGDVALANLGSTLAYSSAIHPRFLDLMEIYFPDRGVSISLVNPASSLKSAKVRPSSVFSITAEVDAELMILPIETMRELLGYGSEVTALEIRGGTLDIRDVAREAGPSLKVLDRYMQHPSLYRMMRYEKAAIFLILIFVVIIVAFNIFGSMSMLIIEKKDDIRTLEAMGADGAMVSRIFVLEGWLISLCGLVLGLVAGIAAVWLQSKTGIVKMPGNFLASAYPVDLRWADVVLTVLGVALIGLLISAGAASSQLPKRSADP